MNTSAFSRASLALAFLASSISLAIPISSSALASQGYYRSPALQGNTVVFTAEGDIWRTSTAGGTAQRLTSHPALESQGLLSPDGQQLAFVADYEGAEEIYLLPLSGGTATRLTFEHSRVRLQQFLADGRILYSTDSAVGPANHWLLKLVDTNSLQSETLPLADASAGVIDTATNMLYFTRFGLQLTGDNAKVYRGGAMGQLWRWRLGSTEEAVRLLPEHQGSISQPQFDNGRLYFVSDADGNTNIWSLTAKGADLTQHSQHQDWRIGRISVQQGRAIYQLGADIYQLELATATSAPLAISLMSDFVQRRERWLDKPLNFLTFSALSPNSKTVALTARSQIALAGTGQQRLVQIATAEGSRSRQAILSPDGKAVYAINDASGENEIWRFAADGSNKAEQLTRDGKVFRWGLHLSPDGRFIAHDDKNGDLWLLDLSSGQNRLIYQQGWGHSAYQEVVWSADSQLLAFTLQHQQRPLRQLVLFSLAENRSELLTSDKYESFSPTFSHDGLWLYFLSNRQFNATPGSPWGDRNLGPMFDKRAEIFAISLKQQACFAFQAIQEVNTCDNAAAKAAQSGRRASLVDWDGLAGRLWQVPVAAGNYQQLAAHEQHLYLLARAAGEQKAELKFIKLTAEDIKLQLLTTDVADYQLAANGKTLFIRKHATSGSGEMLLIDAADKMPANLALAKLNTAGWQLLVKPMQEWQQMFRDAWLMHRDFLFDKNMRGLDWQQSRDKYQPLLARLTDRHELDDIFAQMMGELNALHSQVRGGEYAQDPNSAKAASLGAQLQQA
uniref:S41 family peptidase n=1 Tax=Arsukibacterium sp. TaxID=1977258 RepID=UPI002FD9B0FD